MKSSVYIDSNEQFCVVLDGEAIKSKFEGSLPSNLKFINTNQILYNFYALGKMIAVLSYLPIETKLHLAALKQLKQNYPLTPIICIIKESTEIDLVRKLGALGVDRVLYLQDIKSLRRHIQHLCKNSVKVQLSHFNIKANYTSNILNQALEIIEKDYLPLLTMKEISDRLMINESTLSREFKKFDLINPKRLLMYFKIKHATFLMKSEALSIKEIAHLSGFTNEQRFYECFSRVYRCAPGKYKSRKCLKSKKRESDQKLGIDLNKF